VIVNQYSAFFTAKEKAGMCSTRGAHRNMG